MCSGSEHHTGSAEAARLVSRRGFLRTAAAGAAASAAVGAGGVFASQASAAPSAAQVGTRRVPLDRISIQLYTVRDILSADPEGTVETLAEIGYKRVETAGYAGMTAAQFRALLNANGINATSAHENIPQPFNEAAWLGQLANAKAVGATYVVQAFIPPDRLTTLAQVRQFARDINRAAKMARDVGLRLGYHNHQFEFLRLTDAPTRTAFDVLASWMDPALTHFELDLFWAYRGAHDPVDLIQKHREQHRAPTRQFHVKDMTGQFAGGEPFTDPGAGVIDFGRIFRQVREELTEYIVERDDAGTAPREPADALDTARVGFEFLRDLRY